MYYVYILQSLKDKKLYIGFTKDIKQRLFEHNSGKNFSTKSRIPLKLIYCEIYLNQDDAKIREKFLKTGWGRKYLKKGLRNYFEKI